MGAKDKVWSGTTQHVFINHASHVLPLDAYPYNDPVKKQGHTHTHTCSHTHTCFCFPGDLYYTMLQLV